MTFPSERIMSETIGSYRSLHHMVTEGRYTPYGLANIVSVDSLDAAQSRGEYVGSDRSADVDTLIELTLKLEREEDEIRFLKGA